MDTSAAATAVIEMLMRAGSQDASVLKPAESLLKQWETQPGFYSILAVCAIVDTSDRARLTSMPIMPWHGAPQFRGPPWAA